MTTTATTVLNNSDIFSHMRIINGMGISLCLSRLLIFASKFIQHPSKNKVSYIYVGWIIIVLLWIIQFWWDYLMESTTKNYDVSTYILELMYVFSLFFLCVTITPDDVKEYGNYENYFFSRKKWFFSLFILVNLIELIEDLKLSIIGNNISDALFYTAVFATESIFIFTGIISKRLFYQYIFLIVLALSIIFNFSI